VIACHKQAPILVATNSWMEACIPSKLKHGLQANNRTHLCTHLMSPSRPSTPSTRLGGRPGVVTPKGQRLPPAEITGFLPKAAEICRTSKWQHVSPPIDSEFLYQLRKTRGGERGRGGAKLQRKETACTCGMTCTQSIAGLLACRLQRHGMVWNSWCSLAHAAASLNLNYVLVQE